MQTVWSALALAALFLVLGCATPREATQNSGGIDYDFGIRECHHCRRSFLFGKEEPDPGLLTCPHCQAPVPPAADTIPPTPPSFSSSDAAIPDTNQKIKN